MITPIDFAFVSAKLHGMRSKLYEGTRLEALTTLRSVFEMMSAVFPTLDLRQRIRFERRLVEEHVRQLGRIRILLEGSNRSFFDWQLERCRIENLKVVLRGWKSRQPVEELSDLLVEMPRDYRLPVEELSRASGLIDFIRLLPAGRFGEGIRRGAVQFGDTGKLFYVEAGLDAVYFDELARRAARLQSADREEVLDLLRLEALIYNVVFVMRARLNYDISIEDVREFLVTGPPPMCGLPAFDEMLRAGDFQRMLRTCPERRFLLGPHAQPQDLGELEQLAWERMYHVANRVFYGSTLHMGCVEGFYYVKRVELGNLIRVAELLRQETPAAEIASRLIRLPQG